MAEFLDGKNDFWGKCSYFFLLQKEKLFWGVSIVLLCVLGGVQISSYLQKQKRTEMKKFETLYGEWEKNPKNLKLFEEMKTLLNRNEILKMAYQGKIIQQILATEEDPSLVFPWIEEILSKGDKNDPFLQYTQGTFLIAKKQFSEALQKTVQLKEKISGSEKYKNLYAFTLLRIAALEKLCGHNQEAKLAWAELETVLSKKDKSLSPFLKFFHKGDQMGIEQFVSHQKNSLAKPSKI